jgi:hypothetical protein
MRLGAARPNSRLVSRSTPWLSLRGVDDGRRAGAPEVANIYHKSLRSTASYIHTTHALPHRSHPAAPTSKNCGRSSCGSVSSSRLSSASSAAGRTSVKQSRSGKRDLMLARIFVCFQGIGAFQRFDELDGGRCRRDLLPSASHPFVGPARRSLTLFFAAMASPPPAVGLRAASRYSLAETWWVGGERCGWGEGED